MKAEDNKAVKINYILKGDDGNIIDQSNGEPLFFIMGQNYILPKLEEQIKGQEPGYKFSIVLEAKDGYGEYQENLVTDVARENFETDMPIQVGMQFQAMSPMGPMIVRVTKVADDKITVDGNHELAGQRLHFDVEIVEVRDATEEELNPPRGCCGGGCGGDCSGGCGGEGDCNCGGGCGEGGCGCGN